MTLEQDLRSAIISALLHPDHNGQEMRATLTFDGIPTLHIEWVSDEARKGNYQGLGAIVHDSLMWSPAPRDLQSDIEMIFFEGQNSRPKLRNRHPDHDPVSVHVNMDHMSAHDLINAHTQAIA